ncbi:MAG: hypothetical protein AAFP90_07355, partial [Planctomycetota bacterium]
MNGFFSKHSRRFNAIGIVLSYWARLIYLTRYQIGAALAIVVLPLACTLTGFRAMGLSAFIMDGPLQMFNLSWMAFFVAAMILVLFRMTELNAPDRFPDFGRAQRRYFLLKGETLSAYAIRRQRWRWRWAALLVLWGTPVVTAIVQTVLDTPDVSTSGVFFAAQLPSVPLRVVAISSWACCGAMFGYLLLYLGHIAAGESFESRLLAPGLLPRFSVLDALLGYVLPTTESESPSEEDDDAMSGFIDAGRGASRFFSCIMESLGRGYAGPVRLSPTGPSPKGPNVSPRTRIASSGRGHAQIFLFTLGILTLYAMLYVRGVIFRGSIDPESAFSAVSIMLLIVLLFVCVFAGLAFFFDRFRIPPMIVVGAWML